MKAISIFSALVFAHAAFAQATDSSSSVVVTDSTAANTATSVASSTSAVPTTSAVTSSAAVVSSPPASSTTGSKTKTKSSASASPSPAANNNNNNNSGASAGSIWEDGTTTMTSSGNPFLLSGISDSCIAFMQKMNSDQALSSCLAPMLNGLSTFTTSGSGDASMVSRTLTNICSSNACSASMMRPKLTEFNNACSSDMQQSVLIKNTYDMMYSLIPLKAALCTKDSKTQAYCVTNTGSGSSGSKRSLSNVLYARDHLVNTYVKRGSSQTVFVPNADTFRNTNLMFMFYSPDMTADQLCTDCAQQIMSKWVAFESSTPHALGVGASPMLSGQTALYKAMNDKCPALMPAIVSAAGSPDSFSGASGIAASNTVTMFVGALAALAALA